MSNLFEIPTEYIDVIKDGFDDILDQLGKTCKLVYPATFVECTNCIYDPIGKKSSNRWRSGGPMPFHAGSCPVCNGQGKRATENSENITMTINWTPGKNYTPIPNIRIPIGYIIETRAYMTDFPKIKSCEEMLIIGSVDAYGHFRFKLEGEPTDPFQIASGKYCIALWKRVG